MSLRTLLVPCGILFFILPVIAQEPGTQRAARVRNENLEVQWLGPNDRYVWYEAERENGNAEIVVVDLASGKRLQPSEFPDGVPRLEQGKPGTGINLTSLPSIQRSRNGGDETEIEFVNQSPIDLELKWVTPDGKRVSYGVVSKGQSRKQHTFARHVWLLCDEQDNVLAAVSSDSARPSVFRFEPNQWPVKPLAEPRRRVQLDGESRAEQNRSQERLFVREFNLWKRDTASGMEAPVTTNGNEQAGFGRRLWWSPDRRFVALMWTKFAKPRQVTLIDSAPDDQLQPKTMVFDYAKPGDELDRPQLCIFDQEGKRVGEVAAELIPEPFDLQDVSWHAKRDAVRVVYNERGHGCLKVIEFDITKQSSHVLVEERAKTFVDYAGKFYLEFIDEREELIWMSERDGWNHLYLIDQQTGEVKRQLTKGQWVVRNVVDLDRENRTMLVAVGGIDPVQDPYHRHLLRISLDSDEQNVLTQGDGTHEWNFSPSKAYFLDRYSRVDLPPVFEIRSMNDGNLVAKLEEADASALIESGWTMPKRFVAKARDGVTDIYGIIVYPKGFDTQRTYPVLEMIYAGPHSAHVPKNFQRLQELHRTADGHDGKQFIVVQIDGMGTSHRSKAFHDVCWKNLGDAGFPDRILWMKAAAKEVPQMDLTRVGIWGGSAGGQNAVRALLAHGDFYQAAFADCGCHDNRMDKIWWNELWMSWPIGPHYEQQSNVTQAHRLQGKLMLSVGELDTNVDPSSTYQLVDALIKADKDFELLYFPGAGHGIGSSAYGTRRRIDFFCRSLHP